MLPTFSRITNSPEIGQHSSKEKEITEKKYLLMSKRVSSYTESDIHEKGGRLLQRHW